MTPAAASAVSTHLARLGSGPRPAGGAAAADARAYCADTLRALGFAIREQAFEYSAVPGGWAAPAAGAYVIATVVVLAALGRARAGVALLAFILLLAGLIGLLFYAGQTRVLDIPFMRRRGVNLEAVRGEDEPRCWLVAHLDSKSQPISMIARVTGVLCAAVGLIGTLVFLIVNTLSLSASPSLSSGWITAAWYALLMLAFVGGVLLLCCVVGTASDGALDNASGVAAVLEAAALVPKGAVVGILITDAEELALAGARAWARGRASSGAGDRPRRQPPGIALNCDSVDDMGPLVVMYSRAEPERLVSRCRAAADAEHEALRVMRLIPGILTDSVALADAGWETVTLSRGTLRTLNRIHTRRDSLATMTGVGIDGAARVLARVATDVS